MAIDAPMVTVHRRLGPWFAVLQVARRQDLRVQIWIEGALVDWEVRDGFLKWSPIRSQSFFVRLVAVLCGGVRPPGFVVNRRLTTVSDTSDADVSAGGCSSASIRQCAS